MTTDANDLEIERADAAVAEWLDRVEPWGGFVDLPFTPEELSAQVRAIVDKAGELVAIIEDRLGDLDTSGREAVWLQANVVGDEVDYHIDVGWAPTPEWRLVMRESNGEAVPVASLPSFQDQVLVLVVVPELIKRLTETWFADGRFTARI